MASPDSRPGHKSGHAGDGGVPLVADAPAVREQLERLLTSAPFRQSRRSQSLLRFVVEHHLDGHDESLREKIIGIEVFGRDASYDTSHDAIVRNAAIEVRKRLAQYYLEPSASGELRVELPAGSYVPVFLPAGRDTEPVAPPVVAPRRGMRWQHWAALAGAAALAVGGFFAVRALHTDDFDRFWAPLLRPKETVQVCVGQPRRIFRFVGPRQQDLNRAFLGPDAVTQEAEALLRAAPIATGEIAWNARPYLYMRDAFATTRVAVLLQAYGAPFRLRPDNEASFPELRRNPVVVIGGFNNRWALRFGDAMRFIFDHKTVDGVAYNCITDKRNPQLADWKIPVLGSGTPARDFAVITRVVDPTTERTVILSAGITDYGTLAAGEFLTDRNYMNEALRRAPAGWSGRNVQLVLETKVIEDTPGPAKVLAAHFW